MLSSCLGGFAVAVTAAAISSSLAAQDPPPREGFREISAGYSWHSPRGKRWGMTPNRRLYLAGVQWETLIASSNSTRLMFTTQTPVIIIERTSAITSYCRWEEGRRLCEIDESAKRSAGLGVVPGLKWRLEPSKGGRLYFSAALGAMVFSRRVPTFGSRRANVAAEGGIGLELGQPGARLVNIGYKFYHLSNAGTALYNPGIDANIIYLGMSVPRK